MEPLTISTADDGKPCLSCITAKGRIMEQDGMK